MPLHAKETPSPVLVLALCLFTVLGAQCAFSLPSQHHRAPAERETGGPLHQTTVHTGHPASSGSATANADSESHQARRIAAIKESILATLHMQEPPSPEVVARAKANLSPEDVELAFREYNEKVREISQTDAVPLTRTPTQQTSSREIQRYHSIGSSRESIHFSRHLKPVTLFFGGHAVSSSRRPEHVVDGKLKLYLRPHAVSQTRHHTPRGKTVECSIFMLRRTNHTGRGREVLEGSEIQLLVSREVSLQSPGWKTFHITPAVREWLDWTGDGSTEELALVVTAGGRSADHLFYLEQGSESTRTAALQPRVDVLYHKPSTAFNRQRRQINNDYDCEAGDGVSTCCRYRQQIRYSELGWSDWIIRPTSYESYQCSGSCPVHFRPATAYSRIKSVMHAINPDDFDAPCCAPVRFSSTAYMYLNDTGGLVVTVQQDSAVEECKCL